MFEDALFVLNTFRDVASNASADFYERCFDADGVYVKAEFPPAALDDEGFMREAWGWFDKLDKDKSTSSVLNRMANWVDAQTRQAADETMYLSAGVDAVRLDREITYARVPSGGHACGYCLMLAAYGFELKTYRRIDQLKPVHPHCNCRAVAGIAGKTSVEGFRPDIIDANMQKCADTLGYGDWHECNAMQLAEIREEAGRRDPEWFQTGKAPEFVVGEGAVPSEEEMNTARRLAANGYKSVFRPTRSRDGKRTSDVYFDNSISLVPWEFKGPTGDGRQTIAHQFEEAAGQSKSLVIDSTSLGGSWDNARLLNEVQQKISRKKGFKVTRGRHKGEAWYFNEVIVVLHDGTIRKMKRS